MFKIRPLTFVRGGSPERLLKKAKLEQNWRPTVVTLLKYSNKYCVIRSLTREVTPTGESRPRKVKADLPKGGVDGDTVEGALYREIFEEVRLSSKYIASIRYLGYALVPFGKYSRGRDGFKEGKLYLIYEVIVLKPLVMEGRDHRVVSLSWKSDFWNHFPVGSKKRKIFSNRSFKAYLVSSRKNRKKK